MRTVSKRDVEPAAAQRAAARRTAWILAAVALAFFLLTLVRYGG